MNQLIQIIDLNIPALNETGDISKGSPSVRTGDELPAEFAGLLGEMMVDGWPVQLNPELLADLAGQAAVNQPTAAGALNQNAGLFNPVLDNSVAIETESSLVDNIEIQPGNTADENCGLENLNPDKVNLLPQVNTGTRQNAAVNSGFIIEEALLTSGKTNININNATLADRNIPNQYGKSSDYSLIENPDNTQSRPGAFLRTELPANYKQAGTDNLISEDAFKDLNIKEVNVDRPINTQSADNGDKNAKQILTTGTNDIIVGNSKENKLSGDTGQSGNNGRNTADFADNRQPLAGRIDSENKTTGFENNLKSESVPEHSIDNTINNTGALSKTALETSPTSLNNITPIDLPTSREEALPVRFTLPVMPENTTVKNGHTVTIKMEPAHLGTVRMTVTSINDNITARLVVNSSTAKTAVESNLNNLVEQLDRQGIKVDSFQVSVSGGNVGEEMAEHRFPDSFRRGYAGHGTIERLAAVSESIESVSGERQYITASGVNCFA